MSAHQFHVRLMSGTQALSIGYSALKQWTTQLSRTAMHIEALYRLYGPDKSYGLTKYSYSYCVSETTLASFNLQSSKPRLLLRVTADL